MCQPDNTIVPGSSEKKEQDAKLLHWCAYSAVDMHHLWIYNPENKPQPPNVAYRWDTRFTGRGNTSPCSHMDRTCNTGPSKTLTRNKPMLAPLKGYDSHHTCSRLSSHTSPPVVARMYIIIRCDIS